MVFSHAHSPLRSRYSIWPAALHFLLQSDSTHMPWWQDLQDKCCIPQSSMESMEKFRRSCVCVTRLTPFLVLNLRRHRTWSRFADRHASLWSGCFGVCYSSTQLLLFTPSIGPGLQTTVQLNLASNSLNPEYLGLMRWESRQCGAWFGSRPDYWIPEAWTDACSYARNHPG